MKNHLAPSYTPIIELPLLGYKGKSPRKQEEQESPKNATASPTKHTYPCPLADSCHVYKNRDNFGQISPFRLGKH